MFKKNYIFSAILASIAFFAFGLSANAQTTTDFYCTGGVQTYTVPAGVTKIFVDAAGARGGQNYYYSRPGYGGRVQAEVTVTPGQLLYIYVGQHGFGSCYSLTKSTYTYQGGFNGGGTGYGYGGGGGGATDIRLGGTALSNRILVAGGGGGAGWYSSSTNYYERGGDGGGLTGQSGYGDGNNTSSTKRGQGGTQSAGGAKGTFSSSGSSGSLGNGGNASTTSRSGGGGGGYYGGGGGAAGGGGGGSSYTNGTYCSNVRHTQGANSLKDGNGILRITTLPTGAAAFGYSGGLQTYVVPAGVNFVSVDLEGAIGGSNVHWPQYQYRSFGGSGGRTKCILPVTPGQTLNIYVGGQGTGGSMSGATAVGGAGGYNGGGGGARGATYYGAGGGGGATDIRIGGTSLSNRVVVAGGGGGAGMYGTSTAQSAKGGDGGGLVGQSGIGGSTSYGPHAGGSQTAGGAAGTGGANGTLGSGGNIGSSTVNASGGGGGGYYGGGSGGLGSTSYSAGGGGGSNFAAPTALEVEHYQGYNFIGGGRAIIIPVAPAVVVTNNALSFGKIGTGNTSPIQVFGMTGSALTSSGSLTINTTNPVFEFSFDNNTWFNSSQSYFYTGTSFSSTGLFVRFKPTASIAYSGNITISGGGTSGSVTVALTGNGATACSGTPVAGTVGVSPSSGNASTLRTLTLSGGSTAGGVGFQWQSSLNGTTWTNIPGATTTPYLTNGLMGTTQFRCISTCPGSAPATSGTATGTLTVANSSCTPSSSFTSSTYYVGTSGFPVVITGESTSISDASVYGSGNGGSSTYYNNLSMNVDFVAGKTYSALMGRPSQTYLSGSIWIDFNDDGRFNNGDELVGGYTYISANGALGYTTSTPATRANPSIIIPAGAQPGAHRMRVMNSYVSTYQFPGSNPYAPSYPLMDPCPTTFTYYADTRDYTVKVTETAPTLTASPVTLAFGTSTSAGSNSVPAKYTTLEGVGLKSETGLLNITAPTGFEVSTDGITWDGSITLFYTGGTLAGKNLYVRFKPASAIAYSGNITINGGGLGTPVTVAVSGNGNAIACTGTPTAGSTVASPTSGGSNTTFTLNLTGTSTSGDLYYQWQSSTDGATWKNVVDGIYKSVTINGINNTTQYRCMVWCGSGVPATSSVATITYSAAATANPTCTAGYTNNCGSYPMNVSIASLIGEIGSLLDPSNTGTASTSCPTSYIDKRALPTATLFADNTYNATINVCGPPNNYWNNTYAFQVWIDFNNDGIFTSDETVGGLSKGNIPSNSPTIPIVIPQGVSSGTFLMRIMGNYNSTGFLDYPNMDPCKTGISYGNERDYKVTIYSGQAPCSGTPSVGIVSAGPEASCEVFKANVFNVGVEKTSGLSWNWQSSSSAATGFTNISGATTSSYRTADITTPGTMYYRAKVSCGGNSNFTPAVPVTLNHVVDISDFTDPSVANQCLGSSSVATVNSTSLGTGAFTVTYNLSGINSSSSNTAVLTMGAASGTFTIPSSLLTNSGTTTLTITNIASVDCDKDVVASNTADFDVIAPPDISAFTTPTALNVCPDNAATVTLNSTSIGAGDFTVQYNVSGANTATGSTASATMDGTSGTFEVSGIELSTVGATSVTVTRITNASGCFTNVAADNTASFVVNSLPDISNFTSPVVGNVCLGFATSAQINSTSLGAGLFDVEYSLSGANTAAPATVSVLMDASNGSHAIPSADLLASGATTYTINTITNANGCSISPAVNNTTVFTIGESSTVYSVTGGGAFCAADGGALIELSGSDAGNTYQLYQGSSIEGSPVAGTGSSISFGNHATLGTYTVRATNTVSTCERDMMEIVEVLPPFAPSVYTATGGGNYCIGGTGVEISLSNSDAGIFYQLYLDGLAVGDPVLGDGGPVSFGLHTTAGSYLITASPGTSCATTMAGSPVVIIDPLPTSYSVIGGGNYCDGAAGAAVGLTFASSDVQYTLYNGSSPVTTMAGINASLDFGNMTAEGAYSVAATAITTGCYNDMSGTVTVAITNLPDAYAVSGGGGYCAGGTGVAVGLDNSDNGVSYQLYNGSSVVGSPIVSAGGAISFGDMTTAGIYSVQATGSGCSSDMNGNATVIVNATPSVFTVGGSTAYCGGGAGGTVALNGSTAGIEYQLYSGSTAIGSPVTGTGVALGMGTYTAAGTYTVAASNPVTTCNSNMSGSAVISINTPPTAYTVGGGGGYCVGEVGVSVTLSGSQTGVNYQLYRSGMPVGGPVAGVGSVLSFGTQTEEGIYTVIATNLTTGCTTYQSGSAMVTINLLPTIFPVTGGGNYCTGDAGVEIGVGGSTPGVDYYLYNGAVLMGAAVSGTFLPVSFGVQSVAGTYTVFALDVTSGCNSNMSGSASIGINALPTDYPIAGSGNYCAGGVGLELNLSSSATGINYSLYNGSSLVSVTPGTGSLLSFGLMTGAGTYTVHAVNATTGCEQDMSGSAVIGINSLPVQNTITSTGSSYCAGGAGVTLGCDAGVSGVDYQLYNGATAIGLPVAGDGGPLSFGAKFTPGTYSVIATNATTGCTREMLGTADISINALPVVYGVTGGGSYCNGATGVAIGLTGSEANVDYQLYNGVGAIGSAELGNGAAITFGMHSVAGAYSVMATNAEGCTIAMSGLATATVNTLPDVQTVSGGGVYCAGGTGAEVGLSSSQNGVNYQLYLDGAAIGSQLAGTGSALSFDMQTAVGTYMVTAENAVSGCTSSMAGFATVATNPAPTTFTVTGGGNYCDGGDGVNVMLSGTDIGLAYQLMNGTMPVGGPVTGTGGPIDFGNISTAGSYYVSATNGTTSCLATMAGNANVGINALPTVYAVTGGGDYCAGGNGLIIGLGGSTAGIVYQLYNGATPDGSFVAGTGLPIDFGTKTTAGTYSVVGYNPATGCFINMAGTASIIVNALPVTHIVTGGGAYCNGSSGVNIGLNGSTPGISYQLYKGIAKAGLPMLGTGDAIDFGSFTATGSYSVLATSISSACTANMSGMVSVSINALPPAYAMSGGGTTCEGSAGVNVYLNSSNTGINYQLYNGATPVGGPMPGNGTAINFGAQTATGTYTVMAMNAATSCTRAMNGNVNVSVNTKPVAYTITGGGNYCAGTNGVNIGLAASNTGISYRLYNGTTAVGPAVSGTGGSISFGLQTTTGIYGVVATNIATSCQNNMAGSATVGIDELPDVFNVAGGGSYCAGDAGVSVILSASKTGVSYQLYNGTLPTGTAVPGDGTPVDFGMQTDAGTYRVVASNDLTGCHTYMNGAASVVVNTLPVQYAVTGGGAYCKGSEGVNIGLFPSNTGISYQLYFGGMAVGTPVAGNGGAITFGAQTVAGSYSVEATNSSTGCGNDMSGVATVIANELPQTYDVTGGGSLCAGDAGVSVMLSNATPGVDYQLYNGSDAVGGAVSGAGGPVNFGLQVNAGSYMVVAADNTTNCTANMNGSVTVVVNALPLAQTVTGGGSYCAGSEGVAVGLLGSSAGMEYQLMMGTTSVGDAVAGNDGAISFGMQTVAGSYTAIARNTVTGCTSNMNGDAAVEVNALPGSFDVLANSSSYCAGEDGVNVLLNGSENGIQYQLYNGTTMVASALTGTGAMLDFGAQTGAGSYSVMALNGVTGCSKIMSGAATIVVNPLPTAYTLTGGGGYCVGSEGAVVNLNGSSTSIRYQLYNTAGAVGTAVIGTGGPVTFGPQTAGSYMVIATNSSTTCTNNMTGTLEVVENTLPVVHTLTGGGAYCAGGAGVAVGMLGSTVGVNYQLFNGTGLVGSVAAGTGAALSFGSQAVAGTYHVSAMDATTGCVAEMGGDAVVSVNELPMQFKMTGGGNYCAGAAGVNVGMNGSATGVNYQLYNGVSSVTGAILAGDGNSLDFGTQAASGSYHVQATSTTNGCKVWMNGAVSVVANSLPVAYMVTGGGHYCASASSTGLTVGLSNSDAGVSYQLYLGGTMVGTPAMGGGAISFGDYIETGDYTVVGTNNMSSCSNDMAGTATISLSPAVTPVVNVASSAGATACLGVLTTFNATSINGGAAPEYVWSVNGTKVGLNLSTYQYVPSDNDNVTVKMTSSDACATAGTVSSSIVMDVSSQMVPVANVTVTPGNTVCEGTAVTYAVTPEYGGTAPTYVWKKNGVVVGSGNMYVYMAANGDVITCEMTSNFPCRSQDVVATSVTMSVQTPVAPSVSITANPGTTISAGQKVKFTATVSNAGTDPSYRWLLNGATIQGATNDTYTTTDILNNDEVTCEVASNTACMPMIGAKTLVMKVSSVGVAPVAIARGDLSLIPNPTNGNFVIRGTLSEATDIELNVDVTDMLGQIVYRGTVMSRKGVVNEKVQMDNTLANGMYILNLRSGADVKVFHFVLQH